MADHCMCGYFSCFDWRNVSVTGVRRTRFPWRRSTTRLTGRSLPGLLTWLMKTSSSNTRPCGVFPLFHLFFLLISSLFFHFLFLFWPYWIATIHFSVMRLLFFLSSALVKKTLVICLLRIYLCSKMWIQSLKVILWFLCFWMKRYVAHGSSIFGSTGRLFVGGRGGRQTLAYSNTANICA